VDEDASFQNFADPQMQRRLKAQNAALQGKTGALLHAVDAGSGETLAEYKLPSPPVFDGLSIAGGRVFIATTDGRLLAFAEDGAGR
jgi:hypothetical protein